MTLRLLYELLLAILGLVVAWHFILRPLYRMATRPKRKGLASLDDVVGETNAGEILQDAKRRLGDERALAIAERLNKQAAALRTERTSPENGS